MITSIRSVLGWSATALKLRVRHRRLLHAADQLEVNITRGLALCNDGHKVGAGLRFHKSVKL
jgi:hypothetical protein